MGGKEAAASGLSQRGKLFPLLENLKKYLN